jgi:hypothetical protein
MPDVGVTLASWSSTSASNSPAGTTAIGTGLDDVLREIQGVVVRGLSHKGADIASAATTDLGAVEGVSNDITGTTTITSFGTVRAGIWKIIKFEGALTLTHNATSLILPGAGNISTVIGDIAIVISEGSGNWRCVSYLRSGYLAITSHFALPATGQIWLDGVGDTYIIESSANVVDIVTDNTTRFRTSDEGTMIAWLQREGSYTPGDTTPSVRGCSFLSITNASPTTITNLDGPAANGQVVTLFFNDSNTTINRDAALLAGGSNFTGSASDTLTLRYISASSVWVELCRSVNS